MPKRIALSDFVMVDSVDLRNFARQVQFTSSHTRVDVSGFNATGANEYLAGATDQSVTVDFYGSYGTGEVHETLYPIHKDKEIVVFQWRPDQNTPRVRDEPRAPRERAGVRLRPRRPDAARRTRSRSRSTPPTRTASSTSPPRSPDAVGTPDSAAPRRLPQRDGRPEGGRHQDAPGRPGRAPPRRRQGQAGRHPDGSTSTTPAPRRATASVSANAASPSNNPSEGRPGSTPSSGRSRCAAPSCRPSRRTRKRRTVRSRKHSTSPR